MESPVVITLYDEEGPTAHKLRLTITKFNYTIAHDPFPNQATSKRGHASTAASYNWHLQANTAHD
jgi:hypothetical protein